MKFILTLVVFCFIQLGFSQSSSDTVYYTLEWEKTTYKKIISYYGVKNTDPQDPNLVVFYKKNGTLFSREHVIDDKMEGWCIWYYDSGIKKIEGNYTNDLAHGEFKSYNEKGQLIALITYENDKFVKKSDVNPETGLVNPETVEVTPAPIEVIIDEDPIIDFPEVEAEFPGGVEALQKYITENVVYPAKALDNNEQGRVYLTFVVERDGSISNVAIARGAGKDLNQESLRVISEMPNWKPGESNGQAVRSRCQIPVVFILDTEVEEEEKGQE